MKKFLCILILLTTLCIPTPGAAQTSARAAAVPLITSGDPLRINESEPNNTLAQANLLPSSNTLVLGNIYPDADEDWYQFNAVPGDTIYAAVITGHPQFIADSRLYLLNASGTIIEFDEDDGSFSSQSSSIASASLHTAGTYFLRVTHNQADRTLRPYWLYFRQQSGIPWAEVEPNNTPPYAYPLPQNGWINGFVDPQGDVDFYSISLNAGDTIFLSMDMDPERDNITWNGMLGFGLFGSPSTILVVDDSNTVSPNSEVFVTTVRSAGTYYVYVRSSDNIQTGRYVLSASVIPQADPPGACQTYTNATPLSLADNATTQSTLTIPAGAGWVGDLDVTLNLNHDNMMDLDVTLQAPDGNITALFTDIGASNYKSMDLVMDDEAAIPFSYSVLSGMRLRLEFPYSLDWFDGQIASGSWVLSITDDTATETGTLNNWSLTVCQPAPAPVCASGLQPTPIFTTNFEINDGGFIPSGTFVDWEYGTPTSSPITTCASGSHCWKTNLDGTYTASSAQLLTSPVIDLSQMRGPVVLRWAQKFQMESASFDHARVIVKEVGGSAAQTVWEWLGYTMTTEVGADPALNESAGWGVYWRDISAFLGKKIQVQFYLDSDGTVNLAGLAVDDLSVAACQPDTYLPFIERTP